MMPFEVMPSINIKNKLKCVRRMKLELQKIILYCNYGEARFQPMKLIYINPWNVEYIAVPSFEERYKKKYGAFIYDYKWGSIKNKTQIPWLHFFDDFFLWESTIEHFDEGIDWENTTGYKNQSEHDVTAERLVDLKYFHDVSKVYNQINEHGYQKQRDLGNSQYCMPPEYDEVKIHITPDGQLILEDGVHRLCAARILDIDKIPVRVLVRHEKWQEKRIKLAKASSIDEIGTESREYIDHPDMNDIMTRSYGE